MKFIPVPTMTPEQAESFWEKTMAVPSGCIEWNGYRNHAGYGRARVGGQREKLYVHRIAYTLAIGPIGHGMVIDHLCRNRACVNPAHLEMVTQRVNVERGEVFTGLERGICAQGHAIEGRNALGPSESGRSARCRECNRNYMRDYMRSYRPKVTLSAHL